MNRAHNTNIIMRKHVLDYSLHILTIYKVYFFFENFRFHRLLFLFYILLFFYCFQARKRILLDFIENCLQAKNNPVFGNSVCIQCVDFVKLKHSSVIYWAITWHMWVCIEAGLVCNILLLLNFISKEEENNLHISCLTTTWNRENGICGNGCVSRA